VNVPLSALEALRRVGETRFEVLAFYVFGSRAAGGERPDSDLDVGILYRERTPLAATLLLEEELEQATGLRVDVVDAARANAFLALDIVRGERVFCRDEDEADRFDLYVLRRAGDLLPFERQRQEMLLGPPA